jgi:hypothetical protein
MLGLVAPRDDAFADRTIRIVRLSHGGYHVRRVEPADCRVSSRGRWLEATSRGSSRRAGIATG